MGWEGLRRTVRKCCPAPAPRSPVQGLVTSWGTVPLQVHACCCPGVCAACVLQGLGKPSSGMCSEPQGAGYSQHELQQPENFVFW